ncbi:hypothetical protein D3C72_2506290 [compost metagenome]
MNMVPKMVTRPTNRAYAMLMYSSFLVSADSPICMKRKSCREAWITAVMMRIAMLVPWEKSP